MHKDDFLKTLESLLENFHDKCSARFRGLMSTDQTEVELNEGTGSAITHSWSQNPELVNSLLKNPFM